MKLIKNYIISTSLVWFVMLLVSCNYQVVPIPAAKPEVVESCKTEYAGDYDVLKLRSIWAVCSQTFAIKSPYTPPNLVANICDCYVDEMRKKYGEAELEGLTTSEATEMGQMLVEKCNKKMMEKLGKGQTLPFQGNKSSLSI